MPRRWPRCAAASALLLATACPIPNPAWQESGTEATGTTVPTSDTATATATATSAPTTTETSTTDPTTTEPATTSVSGTTSTTGDTTSDSTTAALPEACSFDFPEESIHFEIPGLTDKECIQDIFTIKAYATSASTLDICAGACENGCIDKLGTTELPAAYNAPLTATYCYDLVVDIVHSNIFEQPCRIKRLTAFDPINVTIPTIIASTLGDNYLDPMGTIPLTVALSPDGEKCGCQNDPQCCNEPPGFTEPHKLTFTSGDGGIDLAVGGSGKIDLKFGVTPYAYKAINLRSLVRDSLVYPELTACNQYQYIDWIMLLQ